MQDIYKNIESRKKSQIINSFLRYDTDMISNKNLNPIVIELFIRGRKLIISLAFFTQSYSKLPKDVRLNSTHFHYENFKERRSSGNCNKSFIRYWL